MRWRLVAVSVVVLLGSTGCPHDWMIEGTNDRAMEKDFKERVNPPPCPEGMKLVADESCERDKDAGACPQVCR
jgi:hypothetical protein